MIRSGALTIAAFLSLVLAPWPLTALLALAAALWEPFLPLAVGIAIDALYLPGGAHTFPLFAVAGAVISFIAYLVRQRLSAGIIGA